MPGQMEGGTERWKNGQNLFYRTLSATTRGPKTLVVNTFLYYATQSATDALKTVSKIALHKRAEPSGDLIENKNADNIKRNVAGCSRDYFSKRWKIHITIKKQQIIDALGLNNI